MTRAFPGTGHGRFRPALPWLLIGTVVALSAPVVATAQSLLLNAPRRTVALDLGDDPFAVGKVIANPRTLQARSADELVEWAAGKPRPKAFWKYEGVFERYWQEVASGRIGKGAEGLETWRENERLAAMGDDRRMLCVAAEGYPTHPGADMALIDRHHRVLTRYQRKTGFCATLDALSDERYAGCKIMPTQDTLEAIQGRLVREEAKTVRRGLLLDPKWAEVKQALAEGRLVGRLPSGAKLLFQHEAEQSVRAVVHGQWRRLARAVEPIVRRVEKSLVLVLGNRVVQVTGKTVGTALIVVDVGTNAYFVYVDYGRWQSGDIGGGYFGFKATLRTAQTGLLMWTVFAPDPTPLTRLAALAGAAVLTVADIVSDPFYEAAQARTRQLLNNLTRDERYYHCRTQVLNEMNRILERRDGPRPGFLGASSFS